MQRHLQQEEGVDSQAAASNPVPTIPKEGRERSCEHDALETPKAEAQEEDSHSCYDSLAVLEMVVDSKES